MGVAAAGFAVGFFFVYLYVKVEKFSSVSGLNFIRKNIGFYVVNSVLTGF